VILYMFQRRNKELSFLEIVEAKCTRCGKKIYVIGDYLKEKMFCTLRCMDLYTRTPSTKD
jgi:hypothetical protein